MKIDRLLGIVTILLQKDKVTAPYLAEKFEVSRRTINRDIEDICKARIPIVTTQGANGGISIAEGYKIEKSVLTYDELEAIITGLKGFESISNKSMTEQIYNKLSIHKESVVSLRDHIIIDLSSHYKDSLAEKVNLIKKAINEKNIVSFLYYSDKGESKRYVEPYFITYKWSSWYVFGYCIESNDFRLFKLNRLWELISAEEKFVMREIPKEKEHLDNYFADEYIVTILFDKSVKHRIIEDYGINSFQETEAGKLLFQRGFTKKEYMLSWILSFGDKAEIIEPQELRQEIKKQAKEILEKYYI